MKRGRLMFALCAAVLALSVPRYGQGREIVLYDRHGNMVPQYATELRDRVQPGDVLVFHDAADSRIAVRGLLGLGATTFVFETVDGNAIRLPMDEVSRKLTVDFYSGYRVLSEAGVAVVRVLESADPSRYVVVEKLALGAGSSLHDFLRAAPAPWESFYERKVRGFLEFARSTWALTQITDFWPRQIHWDEARQKWILVDWGLDRHKRLLPRKGAPTVFHARFLQGPTGFFDLQYPTSSGFRRYEHPAINLEAVSAVVAQERRMRLASPLQLCQFLLGRRL